MKRRFFSFFPALFLIFARIVSTGAVESGGFSGVEDSGGYEEAIQWAAERRYINGYSDGRFVPRISPRGRRWPMRCISIRIYPPAGRPRAAVYFGRFEL